MTDLSFELLNIAPEPYAVVPNLLARVRITESSGVPIHALALRAQVRIEPQRRRYSDAEAAAMADLFGTRDRWASTLKSFLWMQTNTTVQGFTSTCETDIALPCTYDFDVTASKYLHALQDNKTIPIAALFSGTVFTNGNSGRFGVEQIPWDRECSYEMPVQVWKDLVRLHYPNTGWVRLDHDTLAALARFKSDRGLIGFDEAVTDLLAGAEVTP